MLETIEQPELTLFIDKVEKHLDSVVEHGSDQELFIASYLQGHFAVMAGQSQVQHMTKVSQLDQLMHTSLSQAFANDELVSDDQTQVWNLWHSFLN
ncbi:YfcL family protein [Paraglaciecola aquimarina]|uniref:YfcL family protein n=1 Tax=Paraglaciecola aquimarina TaxID=1235557 RepID=A0ABU3T0T6_9ALTE|nr:YfcL family protein [Paraglaciecola aquimarina]MDU0355879.1 YfcL family protein [Paraglaciecola aquimarina]